MQYTWYDLCLLYLVYSVMGWVGETAVAAARGKGFVKRGFAAGPACFVYGTAAVIMTVGFADLRSSPVFLFLGCALSATVVEWCTAKLLERLHNRKWWDYSNHRWNIDGYVCLSYSLLWGVLGCAALLWGNDILVWLFSLLPEWLMKALAWGFGTLSVLDQVSSIVIVRHQSSPRLEELNRQLEKQSRSLYDRISLRMEKRIRGAYPHTAQESARVEREMPFAEGIWLFTIGSLVGDIVETIFCRITGGVWMSRSSLVWGPFSVIWGMALVVTAALLPKTSDGSERSTSSVFVMGFVMGGAYEYICSALGELVFGVVFWDYSSMPFNLGGRINLLYCFFWGVAAVVWIKVGYPLVARGIGYVRKKSSRWLTAAVALFMLVNMAVSALALIRYDARTDGQPPANAMEQLLDERFPDERMERVYPNAVKR